MSELFDEVQKSPVVAMYGRVSLRAGKFRKNFSVDIPTGISPDDLKKCFHEAGENMAIALRLFDRKDPEREVAVLWKHCAACGKDFLTASDVCPNHTGHTLTLILPQPVQVLPPREKRIGKPAPSVAEEKIAPTEIGAAHKKVEESFMEVAKEIDEVLAGESLADPFALEESKE